MIIDQVHAIAALRPRNPMATAILSGITLRCTIHLVWLIIEIPPIFHVPCSFAILMDAIAELIESFGTVD